MRLVRPVLLSTLAALASLLVGTAGPPAAADVLELSDGTQVDGKVIQEKDGFVWVRTLTETKKVAAASVKSRTEKEAAVDVYARLKSATDKDPKSADALWDLYVFLTEHAGESKDLDREAKSIPAKVVKLSPDHAGAHEALGEVLYDGKWVKKEDVARLEAEAARKKKQADWQERLGVVVELADGEHWTLVDNTGAKDLPKKVKEMDDAYALTCEILGVEHIWDGQATAVAFKRYTDFAHYLDTVWKPRIAEWRFKAAYDRRNAGLWTQTPEPFQVRSIPESKTDAEEGMWAAFVHNVVHVAIWSQRRAGKPPAWLEEGLASIVEFEVRGIQKAYCVGTQVDSRARTTDKPRKGVKGGNAGLAGEQAVFKEHCKTAVENNEFPEMRKFLRMDLGEFGPVEAGGAIGLVTWLRQKDPEKFKELWKEIRAGAKTDDDPWRKVYDYKLIEDMEKDWKTWVRAEW